MTAVTDLSLRDVAQRLRSKKVSPVEVTQACLDRIQAVEDKLTAFVLLLPAAAGPPRASSVTPAWASLPGA